MNVLIVRIPDFYHTACNAEKSKRSRPNENFNESNSEEVRNQKKRHVSAAFLCNVIAVNIRTFFILAFILYLVCAPKFLNK